MTVPDRVFVIDLPYGGFGIVMNDGLIVAAPPIAWWMIGKPDYVAFDFVDAKGGTITEVTDAEIQGDAWPFN